MVECLVKVTCTTGTWNPHPLYNTEISNLHVSERGTEVHWSPLWMSAGLDLCVLCLWIFTTFEDQSLKCVLLGKRIITVKTLSGSPLAFQLVSWTCRRTIHASSCRAFWWKKEHTKTFQFCGTSQGFSSHVHCSQMSSPCPLLSDGEMCSTCGGVRYVGMAAL